MSVVHHLDDFDAGEVFTTGGDSFLEVLASRSKPARGVLEARCTAIGMQREVVPGLLANEASA